VTATQHLSRRQLNRTLLRRQLLAEPSSLPLEDAVERVAGLQAQLPRDPYIGLRARLAGFTQGGLAAGISQRRLVRVALMRSTIHLVTAADCRGLRPAVQSALDRELFRTPTWSGPIEGLDLRAVLAEARTALAGQPLTAQELGRRLKERWPERDGRAMAYVVRNLETLIQVPPRGLWGQPGQPRHMTADDWLGSDPAGQPGQPDPAAAVQALVLRYLAAFGPAMVRDIQAWAGVTRLGEVVESLRPRLRCYASEDGRQLWDVPDGPAGDTDAPMPVRFLPEFDNVILGFADRSRILPDGVTFARYHARLRPGSVLRGGVLVDGFLAGTWSVARDGAGGQVLRADRFEEARCAWPADEVEAEGDRLLAFAAAALQAPREGCGRCSCRRPRPASWRRPWPAVISRVTSAGYCPGFGGNVSHR
jgi:hypothetical protein